MKKLIFLFVLGFIALPNFAQDPELFDNPWYLEKLIIDGEDIIPPYLTIEPRVGRISFTPDAVGLEFCDILLCDVTYDSVENIFTLDSFVGLPGSCIQPENFNFAPIYNSIFYDADIPKNPFSYDIVSGGGGFLALTITNGEGNQAIYGNVLLSSPDIILNEIKIYPNPVSDILNLSSSSDEVLSIHMYTIEGKEVSSSKKEGQSTYEIDVAHLESGVYFLRILTVGGQTTKKIIKQ